MRNVLPNQVWRAKGPEKGCCTWRFFICHDNGTKHTLIFFPLRQSLSLSLSPCFWGGDEENGNRFILMVNKQGQTRLAQYYEYLTLKERRALEGEIVRKCLTRTEQQCELDIMFHLEKAHFMLEEMVTNGCIVERSKSNILTPIQLVEKA